MTVSLGRSLMPSRLVACGPTIDRMDAAFSLYSLTEEHELLRKAVRDLAEDRIAPRAAEIDETAEYPWDVHEALKQADLLALHVPEQYGGAGAGPVAPPLVVGGIARVCAASSP